MSTPGHGGLRVSPKALKEYACDWEYLEKHAIKQGAYLFFEEDCDTPLALFDMPRVLKRYAELGKHMTPDELFNTCKSIVQRWHPDYFDIE